MGETAVVVDVDADTSVLLAVVICTSAKGQRYERESGVIDRVGRMVERGRVTLVVWKDGRYRVGNTHTVKEVGKVVSRDKGADRDESENDSVELHCCSVGVVVYSRWNLVSCWFEKVSSRCGRW